MISIAEILNDAEQGPREATYSTDPCADIKLREALSVFTAKKDFAVGDIIRLSPMFKTMFKDGGPYVVAEIFEEPIYTDISDGGSTHSYTRQDMRVLKLARDGEGAVAYLQDSRFFEHDPNFPRSAT